MFKRSTLVDGIPTRTTSVKSIHQFYSELGQRAQRLSEFKGQTKKIGIINRMREAILDDLEAAGSLPEFQDAVKFSRELNDKFTKGAIGKSLGFARGETLSPELILNTITKGIEGTQSPLQSVRQAISANPSIKSDIEGFLKAEFVLKAKNLINNKIDVDDGADFIADNLAILDGEFPELKKQFQELISSQTNVDRLSGVSQIVAATPKQKEKALASLFVNDDPNVAIGQLIGSENLQKTGFLDDLVSEVNQDKTGQALRGLQSGFAEELIKQSSSEAGINGNALLKRVGELENTLLKSKLFTTKQINQMKIVGTGLNKIKFVQSQGQLKEGVMHDVITKLIGIPIQGIAASIGGKLGGSTGGLGGGLRTANLLSKEAGSLLDSLTNKDSIDLLVRSVVDSDLRLDLLQNAKNLSVKDKTALLERVITAIKDIKNDGLNRAKSLFTPDVPVGSVAPAAGSTVSGLQEQDPGMSDEDFNEFFDNF